MPLDGAPEDNCIVTLLCARERIVRGWCQGYLEDEHGNVCLVGAFSPWERLDGLRAINAQLPVLHGWSRHDDGDLTVRITKWNDRPERTQAEVLALVDRTIAAIRRAS